MDMGHTAQNTINVKFLDKADFGIRVTEPLVTLVKHYSTLSDEDLAWPLDVSSLNCCCCCLTLLPRFGELTGAHSVAREWRISRNIRHFRPGPSA